MYTFIMGVFSGIIFVCVLFGAMILTREPSSNQTYKNVCAEAPGPYDLHAEVRKGLIIKCYYNWRPSPKYNKGVMVK